MTVRRSKAEGVELLHLSQWERESYGCIVDFSDGTARWFPGIDCLKDATAYADRHELKVRTVSTPTTIFRDLQGTRAKEGSDTLEDGQQRRPRLTGGVVVFPEQNMLGRLKRQDLLEVDWSLDRARPKRTLKRRGGEA